MIPLVLVLMQVGSLGAARWFSQRWLRNTAAQLLTRADVLDAQKATHSARMNHWSAVCERKRLEVA